MVNQQALLRAYVAAAPEVLVGRYRPDRCLNATWIFLRVLKFFGVRGGRPVSVRATAANATFVQMLLEPGPNDVDAWRARGAWSVVIDTEQTPEEAAGHGGWPGHLVAVLGDTLVDSASGQFRRPEKKILTPEVTLARITPEFLTGLDGTGIVLGLPEGGALGYEARPDDRTYEAQPGWQESQHNLSAARDIAGLVRAHMRDARESREASPCRNR